MRGFATYDAYLKRAIARYPVVVANDEPGARVEPLLCAYAERAGPTSRFRRRAWREFQRALDPLALPKPLVSTAPRRRVGSGAHAD